MKKIIIKFLCLMITNTQMFAASQEEGGGAGERRKHLQTKISNLYFELQELERNTDKNAASARAQSAEVEHLDTVIESLYFEFIGDKERAQIAELRADSSFSEAHLEDTLVEGGGAAHASVARNMRSQDWKLDSILPG